VLLLHGFPTSSHMFRNLIPALADRYHVIAPVYPGYGQSVSPDHAKFNYTFDRYGELVDGLLDQLGLARYATYVMDYDAPVGWRLALKHPERITGLIVQNGNANEGLKELGLDRTPSHYRRIPNSDLSCATSAISLPVATARRRGALAAGAPPAYSLKPATPPITDCAASARRKSRSRAGEN
jgi:pimeloyl-ACP methyl ester carboxylesterase